MRLTLRTLLAYRDRVLRATELESMHARVQQSAMAGNLLKRIDALIQRPTILAPPVDGKGLGGDANSVAEYLDDALAGDKVPELERICLESDVQLAELAQCHQLLSSAMSTSVEVSAALQARIEGLADPEVRAAALLSRPTGLAAESLSLPHAVVPPPFFSPTADQRGLHVGGAVPAATGGSANGHSQFSSTVSSDLPLAGISEKRRDSQTHPVEAPMVASGGASIRPSGLDLEGSHLAHEVPEYLRGRSRDGWHAPLAIGALLALLMLLVWQSIGSWSAIREMLAMRATPAGGDAAHAEGDNADASSDPSNAAIRREVSPPPVQITTEPPTPESLAGSPIENAPSARGDRSPQAPDRLPLQPREPLAAGGNSSVLPSAQPQPGAAEAFHPDSSADPFAIEWLPVDAQGGQAIVLARLTSARPWFRLAPAERLPSGAQFVIPPACRPKLDLARGPGMTVWGPALFSVELPDSGPANRSRVDIKLGKLLLSPSAVHAELDVVALGSVMRVSMADASTRVAMEVACSDQALGPMTDRLSHPVNVAIAVLEGQATVEMLPNATAAATATVAGAQPIVTLRATEGALVRNGQISAVQAIAQPAWLEGSAERAVEALAAQDLHRQWTRETNAEELLLKWITNRRPENRCLAARTLTLMGNWNWLTNSGNTLDESRDRSYWNPVIELGRQVLAVDASQVTLLRSALTQRDRERGPLRAEVWLGLSRQQLEMGGGKQLVSMLESDQLMDRVLGIHELRRITGKDLGYQAGEPSRAAIQQWQRELAAGALVPTSTAP